MEALGGLYVFAVLFLIVLGICWALIPFAIFGTKPILKDILRELKNNNDLLRTMASHVKDQADAARRLPAVPTAAVIDRPQAPQPISFPRPDSPR